MNKLKSIVRDNILQLSPYSSAREEYYSSKEILLDANENPYGLLNRYPDPFQNKLRVSLSKMKKISKASIFIGNGSDQIIDLAFRVFCNPGVDKALTFIPTYGMYQVSADINNVELIKLALNKDFQIEKEGLKTLLKNPSIKLLFLCSPNNPTGNCINIEDILFLAKNFSGIVVIDEAYIDFSSRPSAIQLINSFPNLIVVQTLSKAWGLAGARIGIAYSNPELIGLFNKIKPPYNVSELNQRAACEALAKKRDYINQKRAILNEKEKLVNQLDEIEEVIKVFPSETNFLLVQFKNPKKIVRRLQKNRIIVRDRTKEIEGCLRITVGTAKENKLLVNKLKQIK